MERSYSLAFEILGWSCIGRVKLITQFDMSEQPNVQSTHVPNRDAFATELDGLREHFSPISFLGGGMPSGTERVMMGDTLVDRRSPLPLDNALVQQTKDQIRAIVETIAGLANSPIEDLCSTQTKVGLAKWLR